MKTEYVTPPYTEEMKKVCQAIESKFDNLVSDGIKMGLTKIDAEDRARKILTQQIHPEL